MASMASILSSCRNEIAADNELRPDERRIAIECRIGAEGFKSEYEGEKTDSPVASVHLLAYYSGKKDVEYSGSGNEGVLNLIEGKQYNIYVLANTAAQDLIAPEDEDMLQDMTIGTSIINLSKNGGIPMSGRSEVTVNKDAIIRIPCHRLFARYRLSLTGEGAEHFEASEIRITGVPEKIRPFGYNRATSTTGGDRATTRDLLDFNAGREIVFHLPENMQGNDRNSLCTGIHISGRVHGYNGGGNAVFAFDRKISYDYLLRDDEGGFNIDGNRDYISALQLNRYGWTLSDVQATLEEGSESLHYLFFCDSKGKPLTEAHIKAEETNRLVRLYYRTNCDGVRISSDRNIGAEMLTLSGEAILCHDDIYCNEYVNGYGSRHNDSYINFIAEYSNDDFNLRSGAEYRFECNSPDGGITSQGDPNDLYIAQTMLLSVESDAGGQWQWSANGSNAVVLRPDGRNCLVECHAKGNVQITASGNGKTYKLDLIIKKPSISFSRSTLTLPLKGTAIPIPYQYMNQQGKVLGNEAFDSRLRELLLSPRFELSHSVSPARFVICSGNELYVSTLISAGRKITELDAADGCVSLARLSPLSTETLAVPVEYGLGEQYLDIYTIVPEEEIIREYEMVNTYHIGGNVGSSCPEAFEIPYAEDLNIITSSDLAAKASIDGDCVQIGWPVNHDLCGRYSVELYCRNFRDESQIRICRIGINAVMHLGIRMVSVQRGGLWWLVPVAYDSSTGLFPVDVEYVSWNNDSEYVDYWEISDSERRWGLHRNQIDGGLCISRCEEYFGSVRPALSDGMTVNCSRYYFVSKYDQRPLSEAYVINYDVVDDPYIRIIDLTR